MSRPLFCFHSAQADGRVPSPIPEGSVLHISVLERLIAKIGYAPQNLPKIYEIEN